MRILFDQGTPLPLRGHLTDHSIDTAFELGWSNLQNGDLLDACERDGYQLLVSTDQNLKYQQKISDRSLSFIILLSTSWPRIVLRVDDVKAAIGRVSPGEYIEIPI